MPSETLTGRLGPIRTEPPTQPGTWARLEIPAGVTHLWLRSGPYGSVFVDWGREERGQVAAPYQPSLFDLSAVIGGDPDTVYTDRLSDG